jgi:hypothetical protein
LYRLGAWLDPQGMLSNFPWNAWHIRGFPRDIAVRAEKIEERNFLFGGEVDTDAQQFPVRVVRVNGDLLGAFCGLKGPHLSLGVGCAHDLRLSNDHERLRGDSCSGKLAAFHIALLSTLEGSVDGDDPVWAQHL